MAARHPGVIKARGSFADAGVFVRYWSDQTSAEDIARAIAADAGDGTEPFVTSVVE